MDDVAGAEKMQAGERVQKRLKLEDYRAISEAFLTDAPTPERFKPNPLPFRILSIKTGSGEKMDPVITFYLDYKPIPAVANVQLSYHLSTLYDFARALKLSCVRVLTVVPNIPQSLTKPTYLKSKFVKGIVVYAVSLLRYLTSHKDLKRHELTIRLFTDSEEELRSLLAKIQANQKVIDFLNTDDDSLAEVRGIFSTAKDFDPMAPQAVGARTFNDAANPRWAHSHGYINAAFSMGLFSKHTVLAFRQKLRVDKQYLTQKGLYVAPPVNEKELGALRRLIEADPVRALDYITVTTCIEGVDARLAERGLPPLTTEGKRRILLNKQLFLEQSLESCFEAVQKIKDSFATVISSQLESSLAMASLTNAFTYSIVSDPRRDGVLGENVLNSVCACINAPARSDSLDGEVANQIRADVIPRLKMAHEMVAGLATLAAMRMDRLAFEEFLFSKYELRYTELVQSGVPATILDSLLQNTVDLDNESRESGAGSGRAHSGALLTERDLGEIARNLFPAVPFTRHQLSVVHKLCMFYGALSEVNTDLVEIDKKIAYENSYAKWVISDIMVQCISRAVTTFSRTSDLENKYWAFAEDWLKTTAGNTRPWYHVTLLDDGHFSLEVNLKKAYDADDDKVEQAP